jgi:urease accessory protein
MTAPLPSRARPVTGRHLAARAAVATRVAAGGRTVITVLRSDGPLALRPVAGVVYLVGAAAGPLGGDDLRLDIDVGPGSRLVLRSSAASLLLPGPRGEPSRLRVHARVGEGGHLDFAPQPAVAVAGCDHRAAALAELAPGATLRWREETVLGRHGEPPGHHRSRLDVTLAGGPVYRGELTVGCPGTDASSAVLGGARAAGTVLLVAERQPQPPAAAGDGLAVLLFALPGTAVSATAADAVTLARRLDEGERRAGYRLAGD